jgi:hypothetical protein
MLLVVVWLMGDPMAKNDRRGHAGNEDTGNDTATMDNEALRQSALRAVRNALASAEESVRSIDAALRSKLKSGGSSASTKRRSKARRG